MPYSPFGSCPSAYVTSLNCHLAWWALRAERGRPARLSWSPNGSACPPGSPHSRSALRLRQPYEREAGSIEPAGAPTQTAAGLGRTVAGLALPRGVHQRSVRDDPGFGAVPRARHHRAGLRPLQRRPWLTCRRGRSRRLAGLRRYHRQTCCAPRPPWPASSVPKPVPPPSVATRSTSPFATAAAISPCTYPTLAPTDPRGGTCWQPPSVHPAT